MVAWDTKRGRRSVPTYKKCTGDGGGRLCRFAQVPRRDAVMLDVAESGSKEALLMSGGWIFLGLTALGVIATTIGWSRARAERSDLGYVSRRWLAEQHF